MSAIDVARARRETPACAELVHFNNAGAALMPTPVLDALTGHLQLEARIGGYEAAARAAEGIERLYGAAATLLGCAPDEIAFVENATRAWDMAFYSLPFQRGDRILTAVAEYASNYMAFLQVARRTGVVVDVVPDDAHGQLDVGALRRMIDNRVKLIAMTHVPTNGGLVNPAAAVGAVAREAGIPYLLDACQTAGQLPLDVHAIGCDMLSITGRKYLRGPRGTGLLYVRRELAQRLEPPLIDLHAAHWVTRDRYELSPDARRFENWESFVAGRIALGVAIDYALGWGLAAIRDRVYRLADAVRAGLAALDGVTVRDKGLERCGIVTFTVDGLGAGAVKAAMAARRINVNTSGSRPRLDAAAHDLELVRASVHYYNDDDEVERFIAAMRELLAARAGARR